MNENKQIWSRSIMAILIVVAILLVDQIIKIWVKTHMMLGEDIRITDWFYINFVENNGMAYGMTFINKFVLSLLRIVAVVFIGIYIRRMSRAKASWGYVACLSAVMAGAAGNIFDSLFYGLCFSESTFWTVSEYVGFGHGYASMLMGKVVDMFYFPIIRTTYPAWVPFKGGAPFVFFSPVFNFADACISCGVVALLLFYRNELSQLSLSLDFKKRKTERDENEQKDNK
ncbi:MAG: lipoprotein signal peptidase [Prevotella sp.]|nr:lipoprotein signal peptidase [Prevotella sp.]MDD7046803.1 lipoprotein signal peptidase [Prevotella sp.]MDY5546014.1 lipoprotein signal peptidase [Prevotella sp.]